MSTTAELSENSHQGFEAAKRMLCLAAMQVKSNTASGMPVCLRQNGIGSRSSSKERDAETGLDYFGARYYSGAHRPCGPEDNADLYPGVEFRSELTCALAKIIQNGKFTHAEIAKRAGTSRTRVTAIANGNTLGISTDLLIRVLSATGYKAELRIRKAAA